MEDWTTIRNLKQKNPKLGTRAIARLAGVSRNTVKRALTSQEPPEYTREGKINPDIEPFAKYIEVKIVGLHLTGSRVLEDIKSKGYIGSKSVFYRFIEKIRVKQQRTFKPYETKPGEQAQYDWSPYTVRLGEYITRVSDFCYILGYSRFSMILCGSTKGSTKYIKVPVLKLDSETIIEQQFKGKTMKHYIKAISWKFQDSALEYPQLKNNRVKITAPLQLYE